MSSQLRTDIWNDMVHTDRLQRYYGELAGKLAGREKAMTVVTTVFATLSVVVAAGGAPSELSLLAAALTVAASSLPLIYRLSGVVTSATYCRKRLDDLLVGWRALWQETDELPTDEARRRWEKLAEEKNGITALMSSRKVDEKLRDSTEKQAYGYWEEQRKNEIARQSETRAVLPAV